MLEMSNITHIDIRFSDRDRSAVGNIWRDIEAGHVRAVSTVSKPEGGQSLPTAGRCE